MFYGYGSLASSGFGAPTECTNAEWERDPDGCERRNLDAYNFNLPPPDMILRTNTSAANITSAAELVEAIRRAGGALFVWSSNVNQNSALKTAAAYSNQFKVVRGAQAGEYTITVKAGAVGAGTGSGITDSIASIFGGATGGASGATVAGARSAEPLGGYLPYILGGVGLVVVLSTLKK